MAAPSTMLKSWKTITVFLLPSETLRPLKFYRCYYDSYNIYGRHQYIMRQYLLLRTTNAKDIPIVRYEKMVNDRRSTEYRRKIRLQKMMLLGITGVLAYEIINSYLNFHNQVSQYTQSIAYREAQEASKEYSMKLMKRNQQLLSREELTNKNRYQDTD